MPTRRCWPRLAPLVQRIARAVKEAYAADGVTVVQFNEPASGQTVFHLHFHVIPRHDGVPLMPHGRTDGKAGGARRPTRTRSARR